MSQLAEFLYSTFCFLKFYWSLPYGKLATLVSILTLKRLNILSIPVRKYNNFIDVIFVQCLSAIQLVKVAKNCRCPCCCFAGSKACSFEGLAPDPHDCTAYYHCSGRRLYHYRCGLESVFNTKLLSCTAPTVGGQQCKKVRTLPEMQPLGGYSTTDDVVITLQA